MFFLLRVAFWLTIVLALLPSGGAQQSAQAKVGPTEAVVAAGAAVSDMSSFCDRQPDACVVGAQAAVAIGQRAQAGAKMVYEFFNDHASHGSETGSVTKAQVRPQARRGGPHRPGLPGLAEHAESQRPRPRLARPAGPHAKTFRCRARRLTARLDFRPDVLPVFLRPARRSTLYKGHGHSRRSTRSSRISISWRSGTTATAI